MSLYYKKLAVLLDKIPNGFPPTESGVELKILAKLFMPEEAELASHLTSEPESSKSIAHRLEQNEKEILSALIGMIKRGLIGMNREKGGMSFYLIPFVVGFYELQNAKIDKEFAELFEQYYKEAFHKMTMIKPSVHRIIPVEKTIPVGIDVMSYQKASTYIESAKSWGVLNCICRVQQNLIGKGCNHSIENCLVISPREGAYDKTDSIRTITKQEALDILAKSNEEGLVHSTSNVQLDVTYICNCCTCSCGILRSIVEYGNMNSVAGSDFFAVVDEDLCSGCAICIDRCQFKALNMIDDIISVNKFLCLGCGLCVTTCTEGAITLKQKESEIIEPPPFSESDWKTIRSDARKFQN
ncbi:MAG: 4Fe-4S binding protein [Melioribacteraceae bacterium]